MRILLTADPEIPVPPTEYGGIQRMVDQLIRYLKSSGNTIGLIGHQASNTTADYFIAWKTMHSQGVTPLIKNQTVVRQAYKDFAPDVVHSFSRLAFLLPVLLRRIPTLMSYQREPGKRQVAIASSIAGSALHFSACSEYIASLGRRGALNWEVIPNFLDDALYTGSESVPDDAPFVFLSRLDRIKGAHTAIALCLQAKVPLVIAGNAPDQKYFASEIEPHLDNPLVSYIGAVDDTQKQKLLSGARALLLPLEWDEPFGIVFIEALACGTPVITAPRGAAPEIIKQAETGYLCQSQAEYVEAMQAVAQLDRKDCIALFEEEYTTTAVGRRYFQAYQSIATVSAGVAQ